MPRRAAIPKSIEPWTLARADDDVRLALQVRVRDACRMHRAQCLEQRGEERGAIRERMLVRAQRRPRDVLEREILAVDEAERARHPGHARELLVDRVLAAQQVPVQRSPRVRCRALA